MAFQKKIASFTATYMKRGLYDDSNGNRVESITAEEKETDSLREDSDTSLEKYGTQEARTGGSL